MKKNIFLMLTGYILIFSLLVNDKLTAGASEFRHVHTEACYSQALGPCHAPHQSSTRTTVADAHCSYCGTTTPHTVYVYWDHCFGTGEDFELGGKKICSRCGRQTYSWGSNSAGQHQVYQRMLTCGKDGQVQGRLWLKNAAPGWTKENVPLEAKVEIYREISLPQAPYSWDGGKSWTGDSLYEASENGTYQVYVRSQDGRSISETVRVANIDRTGPSLTGKEYNPADWTKDPVRITLTAEDIQPDGSEGCGLSDAPFSFDGGNTYLSEGILTVSENGTFPVLLKDSLDNTVRVDLEVTNIDKTPPVIGDIKILEEDWQKEKVSLQVAASDGENQSGLNEKAYSMDGICWQESPVFTCFGNGEYPVYVRDRLENTSTAAAKVGNIDKTPPVICDVAVQKDQIFKEKVFVTIEAEDLQEDGTAGSGLHERAYSLDGGESWQKEKGFWVEEGKQYEILVRDRMLWQSESRVLERKDFPYPPEKEVPPEERSEKTETESSGGENSTMVSAEEKEEPRKAEKIRRKKQDVKPEQERKVKNNRNSPEKSRKEVLLPEKQKEQKILVKEISQTPWYETKLAKKLMIGTEILLLLAGSAILFYLFWNTVPVFSLKNREKYKFLGRLFIHRKKREFRIDFPEYMRESSDSSFYRIRFSKIQLYRFKNNFLVIENKRRNVETVIQETIDFML